MIFSWEFYRENNIYLDYGIVAWYTSVMKLLKDLIPYQQPPIKISPIVEPFHSNDVHLREIMANLDSDKRNQEQAVAIATALGFPDLGRKP